MKKQLLSVYKFPPVLMMMISLNSSAQVNQEYTFELTTTKANTMASKALIDVPGLTDNPSAIIIATQTGISNPHPIGAWFYSGKWNLFNSDHTNLLFGLTYRITYFLNKGNDQITHIVTQKNSGSEGSYINHAKLNSDPHAKFDFFQNHGVYPTGLNSNEVKVGYSPATHRWYITNINGQPLTNGAAYNIVIYSSGSTQVTTTPVTAPEKTSPVKGNSIVSNPFDSSLCNCPVQKLSGRPLSNNAPTTGQVLKWNGGEWEAADDDDGSKSGAMPAWSVNGNNLSNTKAGNVGVGFSYPAYQLDVNNRMRIRSGGNNNASAGIWLNNNANTEAAFIGMEDDTHVGLYGKTAGWKFGMNIQTGALKVNGNEGKPGQVLISNGSSAAAGFITLITTASKKGNGTVNIPTLNTKYHLSELSHIVILTRKSQLIISANVSFQQVICIGCADAKGFLHVKLDGSEVTYQMYSVGNSSFANVTICNFIIELDAGTHNIEFIISPTSGPSHQAYPKSSSIIILPVD